MVVIHTHAEYQGQRSVGSQLEWKQTDGRTRPIAAVANECFAAWLIVRGAVV